MIDSKLLNSLFERLKSKNSYVVFAESLTGGLISSEFSKIPGVSAVLWGSFVVYNSQAKLNILKVPKDVIQTYGVVSRECALEMAKGAIKVAHEKDCLFPSCSLAVTGLAGPLTAQDKLKVGTVCIAVAKIEKVVYGKLTYTPSFDLLSISEIFHFEGDRNDIREETLNKGVELLLKLL
mgnify:CR=1 FL=1|jgi:putative competence-damage inducible protein